MAIKNTRTARSYINTAATQLYSIFVFVFIFFSLLLYTTRKGWFVFLACLKPLSKRATKREARLDFVDGCATSTAGMDKIRQSVVVTQPLYCPFFVQRAHVYKKKKNPRGDKEKGRRQEDSSSQGKETKESEAQCQPSSLFIFQGKSRDPKRPQISRGLHRGPVPGNSIAVRDTLNMDQRRPHYSLRRVSYICISPAAAKEVYARWHTEPNQKGWGATLVPVSGARAQWWEQWPTEAATALTAPSL